MENKKFIQNQSKTATLLVNFGGPSTLNTVKPFLYNLFLDPTVLNFPFAFLYRKPLAWLIANMRDMTSREMYKKIGSISPLIPITYLQAEKLQDHFHKNNLLIDVFVGFRYCRPLIKEALDKITNLGYEKLIILPLYPQYSFTTTGSVELIVNEWLGNLRHCEEQSDEAISKCYEIASPSARNDARKLELYFIKEWYNDSDYISSYVHLIEKALEHMDLRSTEIIFSAHSIPLFNVKNGDPYEKHIVETAKKIINALSWKKRWHISYQSKFGPIKWLEPGTDKVIEEIARRNQNANILLVPISFVCEHVETIFEIGHLYREIANKHGIKKFVRVPALNTDKYLIQALYNQVIGCLESNHMNIKEVLLTK
ncbi:MAG: ferrochelatase [Candidatus Melainabacteria bacterium]|nr:ferrochelatase [Candidatus Melainabacteria bacterium]